MKDLEKQIKEAAYEECSKLNNLMQEHECTSDVHWDENDFHVVYKYGIKSELAKQYWQQGMYSEKEVFDLLWAFRRDVLPHGQVSDFKLREWFQANKK